MGKSKKESGRGVALTKSEAVRRALAAGKVKPLEGSSFIKQMFGLDVSPQTFSSYKFAAKSKPKVRSVTRGKGMTTASYLKGAKTPASGVAYYYTGGTKIRLAPADDLYAVGHDKAVGVAGGMVGRSLGGGLRLVTRAQLGAAAAAKPTYPVYRAQGATLVVLPEVRVEESRAAQRAELDRWLAAHGESVAVVSRDDDRVVLRPVSGSGEDALAIANDLAEEVGPELAQARFIRVVPRPEA
jgi:hypothetical protein